MFGISTPPKEKLSAFMADDCRGIGGGDAGGHMTFFSLAHISDSRRHNVDASRYVERINYGRIKNKAPIITHRSQPPATHRQNKLNAHHVACVSSPPLASSGNAVLFLLVSLRPFKFLSLSARRKRGLGALICAFPGDGRAKHMALEAVVFSRGLHGCTMKELYNVGGVAWCCALAEQKGMESECEVGGGKHGSLDAPCTPKTDARGANSPPRETAASGSTAGHEAPAGRRKRRRIKTFKNQEEVENQRMTHIAVERNRRKQMNEYLGVLRSLMPASYVQRVRLPS
ncbi:hypothetical protein B296_00058458, partial [Ensete ventricosum]